MTTRFSLRLVRTIHSAAIASLLAGAGTLAAVEEKPLPKDLPAFGPDKPLPVPTIVQSKLPNGMTVWLVKRPGFPKVTALLAVRGGTAADPMGAEGMSELLSDTLKEGTATRTSRKIAEELQASGGEIAARATNDAVIVTVDGLATGTSTLLNVLSDIVQNASFPPAEVELAKGNALQGLQVRASTPEFLASKAFSAAVYGAHPYHTVAPTAEIITAVKPETLRQEFRRRFRPERALLIVAGDLDTAQTSQTVTKLFGGWKAQGEAAPATPPSPGHKAREILLVDRPGSVQSVLTVGRPTVKATEPDYYPLLVANTIFGGAFGSRLTLNIREEKGYTYSPSSRAQTFEQGGLLQVKADVRNDVTAASLMEIFYEMDCMGATTATPDELSKAKRYQGGLYLIRNQIQGSVAGTLATNWINGLPPEALADFVPKVNAVTAEQVRHVGQEYYPSSQQTVVVVGDESKIKGDIAQFGTVTAKQP
jgi:predicted Zn-dependent peptidase